MPFRFRFETLLSYRSHLKDQAEIAFAKANRHLIRARESLADAQERLGRTHNALHRDLAVKMVSDELRNHVEYIEDLENRIRTQEMEVTRWKHVVQKRLQELLARNKQHQVIEKLRGKDHQKWLRQQGLAEQQRLDELAVTRHGRSFL